MSAFLNPLISWLEPSKYFLIFLGVILEGPVIMMSCGFLLKLGYVSFIPTYFALMAGDLVADAGWYGVGYFFGNRFVQKFGKFFGITDENIEKVKGIFHRRKNSILFISKITMGFGFSLVTLIVAGLVKIPFKRYLAINIIGQFIWTGILLFIGFSFGNFYSQIANYFGRISGIAFFIVIFFLLIFLGKYFRGKMTKTNL